MRLDDRYSPSDADSAPREGCDDAGTGTAPSNSEYPMIKIPSWKLRHSVIAIMFTASIVSFMDRMAMSVVLPFIKADFQLGAFESGAVMSAFFVGYSLSQIPGGLLSDRFGIRRVLTVAMLWWSFFTAITGLVGSFVQMLVVRVLFGAGEGVFPASAFKTVAVWFPKRERATANAIMLSSSRLGAAIAPLVVVALMHIGGWRTVFFSLFIPGLLVTLLCWLFVADSPFTSRRITPAELADFEEPAGSEAAPTAAALSIRDVLRQENLLKYCLIYFTFDFAYWGFTSWLPTYLIEARGFSMVQMGIGASLPFLAGTVGCVFGGWLSDRFFSGRRKILIVAAQLSSAALLYLTFISGSTMELYAFQTLAGLTLSIFFAAFWAMPMNTVPKERMGVTSGIINTAGQVAAIISPVCVGYLIEISGGSFALTFAVMIISLLMSCAIAFTLPNTARAVEASFEPSR